MEVNEGLSLGRICWIIGRYLKGLLVSIALVTLIAFTLVNHNEGKSPVTLNIAN